MTDNERILASAIKKAMDNGWKPEQEFYLDYYKQTIFNHEFAKSIWKGNILLDGPNGKVVTKEPIWKHHLMMMVVDPDPIAYLGRNLDV